MGRGGRRGEEVRLGVEEVGWEVTVGVGCEEYSTEGGMGDRPRFFKTYIRPEGVGVVASRDTIYGQKRVVSASAPSLALSLC